MAAAVAVPALALAVEGEDQPLFDAVPYEEEEPPLALTPEAYELPAGTKVATLELDDGGFVEIQLLVDETPETAGNFVALVEDGFYDGIVFHRVVEAVSMARLARTDEETGQMVYGDTSPTQFFILTGDSPHLDPDFCVFGVVVTGMDVVDEIEQGDVIRRIRVQTVGE